jgi:hypothetical protein
LLHGLEKLPERGLCQHAAELRPVIVDQAYVFNDHVVYLPIAIHIVKPVIDGIFLSFAVNDSCGDFCVRTVGSLLKVSDFLTAVSFDLVQIGPL